MRNKRYYFSALINASQKYVCVRRLHVSMPQTKWTSMDDSCHAFNMTYDRCCTKRKTSRILKTLEAMLGCRPHCNHPYAQCFFLSFFNSTITFLMVSLTQFFGQINLSATDEPLLSYLVMANFFKNLFDFFFQSASCDNDKKKHPEKNLWIDKT